MRRTVEVSSKDVLWVSAARVFVVEATTIGLQPGEWPYILKMDGREFERDLQINDGGWRYTAHGSADAIEVINDYND